MGGEVWRNGTPDGAANPQTVTLARLRYVLVGQPQHSDLEKLERADFLRFYASQWRRPAKPDGGVIAEGVANLFRDAAGARAGNDPLRSLSRTQGADSTTPDVSEIPPLELGKRGWGYRLSGGDEAFIYGFVLRNAVIFVKMLCWHGNCAPDEHVRQAAADYAGEIVRRATR